MRPPLRTSSVSSALVLGPVLALSALIWLVLVTLGENTSLTWLAQPSAATGEFAIDALSSPPEFQPEKGWWESLHAGPAFESEQVGVRQSLSPGLPQLRGTAPVTLHAWSAYVSVESPGPVRISITTDAPAILTLNGQHVVGFLGKHRTVETLSRAVNLQPGWYLVRLLLQDGGEGSPAQVSWEADGATPLPLSRLEARIPASPEIAVDPPLVFPDEGEIEQLKVTTTRANGLNLIRATSFRQPYLEHWPFHRLAFPQHLPGHRLVVHTTLEQDAAGLVEFRLEGPGRYLLRLDGQPLSLARSNTSWTSVATRVETGEHRLEVYAVSLFPASRLRLLTRAGNGAFSPLGWTQLHLDRTERLPLWQQAPIPLGMLVLGFLLGLGGLALRDRRVNFRQSIWTGRRGWGTVLLLLLAASLRLQGITQAPPQGETMDELANAWNGWSILHGDGPRTWADRRFHDAYPDKVKYIAWDNTFTFVAPYLDRPPLFPALLGVATAWTAPSHPFQLRLPVLRLLPCLLSLLTLLLLLGVGRRLYGEPAAWIAGTFYACTPLFVWSQRLAKEESLLTPIWLLGVSLVVAHVWPVEGTGGERKLERPEAWRVGLTALLAGLSPWCKEVGVVAIAHLAWCWWAGGQRRAAIQTFVGGSLLAALYPIYGMAMGGALFWKIVGLQGNKETDFAVALRFLTEGPAADRLTTAGGGVVLFLILCLLLHPREEGLRRLPQVAVFLYLSLIVALVWSDGIFGWYRLPLIPFLCLAGGVSFLELRRNPGQLLPLLMLYLVLWPLLGELRGVGLSDAQPLIRLSTGLLLLGLLPALVWQNPRTLRLATRTVDVLGVLILGLSVVVCVVEIYVYG